MLIELIGMAEPNKNSDKTTFKVKHFDEYHDIVIDWNDDRHEYKYQQLFEQLESITGVPNRYTNVLGLRRLQPTTLPDYFYCGNQIGIQGRPDISEPRLRDGECFRLICNLSFEWFRYNRICMNYSLVAEDGIPEGVCSQFFCQNRYNKAYFKNIKDIVNNEELNLKISQILQPVGRGQRLIADQVFRKFNIKQYFSRNCEFWFRRMDPDERIFHRHDYQRNRG
ncbi:uncharacterized protein LOC107365412 [Tetranychus urticae]|uniref:Uncharacterized protein n=1 Tax=Tetranychus urticae TaxID=32264 RepID=T1KN07_TETUR|nr:uncharacterized protein LOC107365412 [Tetranychus urticae]